MSIRIQKFARKPFTVDAVLVTEDNMAEVAKWCGGTIEHTRDEIPFVKVDVVKPLNTRQTRAFAGDRVLHSTKGFKVYTQKPFDRCFEATGDVEVSEDQTAFNVFDDQSPDHLLETISG